MNQIEINENNKKNINGDINNNKSSINKINQNNINDNYIKMYVVIYNISKKRNIGTIIRNCVAFNVHKIFIINRNKKKKDISSFGNMGSYKYIKIEYFDNIIELKEYLKKNNILLYGCEITKNSVSVTTKPFIKDTAFLFGNEGMGIDNKILNYCDKIIYIPQYGNGISSLNVSVSCAIILQYFATWANYIETEIKDKKFVINKCNNKLYYYLNPSEELLKEINEKRLIRSQKKQNYDDIYLDIF